jgi:hypothetical protein
MILSLKGFSAVTGYVDINIFISCRKFSIAIKLPEKP